MAFYGKYIPKKNSDVTVNNTTTPYALHQLNFGIIAIYGLFIIPEQ